MKALAFAIGCVCVASALCAAEPTANEKLAISGVYPHLAVFNSGNECGIGAVVPWADRLWAITYAPHEPLGSDDKLWEITPALDIAAFPGSVGGTPAGRFIHRPSNQLVIGAYLIDAQRNVRVIPPSAMPIRITAVAEHLTDPANFVYYVDMEGPVYEANVHTLEVNRLFAKPVPGWHGKGAYTSQGVLVVANNGEHKAPGHSYDTLKTGGKPQSPEDAGVLAEYDGKRWSIIQCRQFTDVTGPGGIHGSPSRDAPLWSIGWDKRSILLMLRDAGRWHTFRMPKADYSYDGHHGWHTEWPRIRQVTGGKYLMNLHGGWFDFPGSFSAAHRAGIAPLGSYLKVTGDLAPWRDRIVFGCDHTARSGFFSQEGFDTLNSLNAQSHSNFWFATWEQLRQAGRPAGYGGPWINDSVKANAPSEPYLFAGYTRRVLHLAHRSDALVKVTVELGDGGEKWSTHATVDVPAQGYAYHVFAADTDAPWLRLRTDRDAVGVTACLHYGPGGGAVIDRKPFDSLADADDRGPWTAAVLRTEGENKLNLAVRSQRVDASGALGPVTHHHVDEAMRFTPVPADSASAKFLDERTVVTGAVVQFDAGSVIVREGKKVFRLPRSSDAYDRPFASGWPRMVREVVTERALMNVAGTFYMLPRTNSGGVARIKPVCTHNKRITDFCSWRGLIVLAGTRADAQPDGHCFASSSGDVGLWFGDIDDLWKLGKPRGVGGPWHDTAVQSGEPSDPYLMTGYDRKTLRLSHDAGEAVRVTVQVDVTGEGVWHDYATLTVPAREQATHVFPDGFAAHWVRFVANRPVRATATLVYE